MDSMSGGLLHFEIPLSREDLLRESSRSHYSIKELIPPQNISMMHITVSKSITTSGFITIQENFNFFFSAIMQYNQLKGGLFVDLFKLLRTAARGFLIDLAESLKNRKEFNDSFCADMTTCIKMFSYLMSNFAEVFMKDIYDPNNQKTVKRGKGTKMVFQQSQFSEFWENNCSYFVSFFHDLVNCPISHLWKPPMMEPTLVNLIGGFIFNFFANYCNDKSVKDIKEKIFNVIGILVAHHNYSEEASIKIVNIIAQKEQLVVILAESLSNLITKMPIAMLLMNILTEIERLDLSDSLHESARVKNISTFLSIMGENHADQMQIFIHLLEPYLELEHYTLRSCVLGIFGNIIVKHLQGDGLDSSQKKIRDDLLDLITAHIHDVNAFVRAKDLQTLNFIVANQALPLTRAGVIMKLLVGRLQDKSLIVRKRCVELLITFLRNNPFAINISHEEICSRRESEAVKLKEMEAEDINNYTVTENDSTEPRFSEETAKQNILVKYLTDCAIFIENVQNAIPLVAWLLETGSGGDVAEAIEFYVVGSQLGMNCCKQGLVSILKLVLLPDKNVVNLAVDAFRKIYFSDCAKNNPIQQMEALMEIVGLCNVYSALEIMMEKLYGSGDICLSTFKYIFKRFVETVNSDNSNDLVVLFYLVSCTNPELIRDNFDVFITSVFRSERMVSDLFFAKYCIMGLTKMSNIKLGNINFRLATTHELYSILQEIFINVFSNLSLLFWYEFCHEFLMAAIRVCQYPDKLLKAVFTRIKEIVFTNKLNGFYNPKTWLVSRFLFTCGEMALVAQNFYENYVCPELRRRRRAVSKDKKKLNESVLSNVSNGEQSENISDIDGEIIQRICQNEIVTGNGLLAMVVPLMLEICHNTDNNDKFVVISAAISLGKYMYLSPQLCASNIQLLATLMDKSPITSVRSNLVIIFGDLISRHPNIVGPWASYLYKRFEDDEVLVRRNTVVVVSRLVLNEVVKAKGAMTAIAKCVVDSDYKLVNNVRFFFTELSQKGNTLFNILPDIISRLMDDTQVDQDNFERIMTFLFSLITKNTQNENLVEKLCYRFRTISEISQLKKLALCLSKLPFTDKSITKLQDNINCFSSYLYDPEIYNYFCIVLAKALKTVKSESKDFVDELKTQFLRFHENNGAETTNMVSFRTETPARTTRKKVVYDHSKSDELSKSSETEEIENFVADMCSPLNPNHARSVQHTRRGKRKATFDLFNSDDSD